MPDRAVRAGLWLWAMLGSFGPLARQTSSRHAFTLTLVYAGPGLVSYLASVFKSKP